MDTNMFSAWFQSLVAVSSEDTARLVLGCFSDRLRDILDTLQSQPELLYKLLRAIFDCRYVYFHWMVGVVIIIYVHILLNAIVFWRAAELGFSEDFGAIGIYRIVL